MLADLRPYPASRDSGLPWLGQVPTHWEVRRNGRLFTQRNETGFADLPILEVSLRTGVRVRDFDGSQRKQVMSDRDKYKRAARGDVTYNIMRLWQGAVGVAPVDGLVSPAYVVARPHSDVDGRYYAYLFRTDAHMREVDQYSRGIVKDRNRLYWDEFKQMPSPFPPPSEQRQIANFLDEHGRCVRQLVRNKLRLIELLEEQKQAVITRAVTRGLDGTVPLSPSGVDWLGAVPQHWTLRRFKFLARINSGQVDPRREPYRDYVLVAPDHIESGTGKILLEESAREQGAISGKHLVRAGQVMYSKIRPNLRKATIARTDCLCSADMYPISAKSSELRPDYFLLLLSKPFTTYAVDCSMRVAMPKVNREPLGDCWLCYPSLVLQRRFL